MSAKAVSKSTKKPDQANNPTAKVTGKNIGLVILACVLLLIANSALWVNNVLFNTESFTSVTSQALLSESSRNALAGEVVDKAFNNRPVAARVISEPATKLVSGLLDTNLAKTATNKVVEKLHTAVTTSQPQNVELDLSGVKNIANRLIEVTGSEDKVPEHNELPDTLVLLDTSKIPNVYQYGVVALWLAPLSAVIALVLLALPHIRQKRLRMNLLAYQGGAFVLTGFTAMLAGPLFRPMILGQVASSNVRVVVENIYNGFIATFNTQSDWFFVAGFILLAIPAGVYVYRNFLAAKFFRKTK